jgi:hypothetical protein
MLHALRAAEPRGTKRATESNEQERIVASADPWLLRRVLHNLWRFSRRMGGTGWKIEQREGRVLLSVGVDGSHELLKELLTATSLSATEADTVEASLAAARWMIEMMNGTLTVSEGQPILHLSLPAADSSPQ